MTVSHSIILLIPEQPLGGIRARQRGGMSDDRSGPLDDFFGQEFAPDVPGKLARNEICRQWFLGKKFGEKLSKVVWLGLLHALGKLLGRFGH
jgi:hypothetical protein